MESYRIQETFAGKIKLDRGQREVEPPARARAMLSVRANAPENARLTFDHIVSDRLQDMGDTNFKVL